MFRKDQATIFWIIWIILIIWTLIHHDIVLEYYHELFITVI